MHISRVFCYPFLNVYIRLIRILSRNFAVLGGGVAAPSEIGKKIAREPFVKLSIHKIFQAILNLIVFAETISVFNS